VFSTRVSLVIVARSAQFSAATKTTKTATTTSWIAFRACPGQSRSDVASH
jgi:hypothetical protein